MAYHIYEDLNGTSAVKIHHDSCERYIRHLKRKSKTTQWYKTDTLDDAKIMAESISKKYKYGWKEGDCCKHHTIAEE